MILSILSGIPPVEAEALLTEMAELLHGECIWHWLILMANLLGLTAAVIFYRLKKDYIWISAGTGALFSVVFVLQEGCALDGLFAAVGILITGTAAMFLSERLEDYMEEEEGREEMKIGE